MVRALSLAAMLAASLLLPLPSLTAADLEQLTAVLRQLDTRSIPEADREAARGMIGDYLRREQKRANDASSAAWRGVETLAHWRSFREEKLTALRDSLRVPESGGAPRAVRVRRVGELPRDGAVIERLLIESRTGWFITANLYRPTKRLPKMPGILISHAHHTPKEHGELQDMGILWANAGCLVLIPDHLGHGERRQHPFVDGDSYARPYRVSRQDYYFRYDNDLRLSLVGESLMGWLVHDLHRCVDTLLAEEGIDPGKIALLGAVAGGGDPCAVAAALDERITCAAPFNFGGPQPETRYPLPDDAETSFNYAGSGSWESTRNLRSSAARGFLPWVTVGGIAPRRLIFAHEFAWDQERDPVWKRLQRIYALHGAGNHLDYSHGRGELRQSAPQATHCTHIGPPHRERIHAAFERWFGIRAREMSDRVEISSLRCWNDELRHELQPKSLDDLLPEIARGRSESRRAELQALSSRERRESLRTAWSKLLFQQVHATNYEEMTRQLEAFEGVRVARYTLRRENGLTIPLLLLEPAEPRPGKRGTVIAFSQAGKEKLLAARAEEFAKLLQAGVAVCLLDLCGTGETTGGGGRGRVSGATSQSAGLAMIDRPLLGMQLADLLLVAAWVRGRETREDVPLALWGDSLAPLNPSDLEYQIPRDNDDALPPGAEPIGHTAALLAALFDSELKVVYTRGGLASYASTLPHHLVLLPHEAVVPGAIDAGDLPLLAAALEPASLRFDHLVDGLNRAVDREKLANLYGRGHTVHPGTTEEPEKSPAEWLLEQLAK